MDISASVWISIVLISSAAGFAGSLLGLGGGFIVVPALTLLYGMDMRSAVGVSLIAVIATSSGSSVTYLKKTISNLELAAFLEISTVIGAVTSVFVADHISPSLLFIGFSAVLVVSSMLMLKKTYQKATFGTEHKFASPKGFHVRGEYLDHDGERVAYVTRRNWLGFGISGIAGLISGLLGVGGGVIKVPTMNLVMGVPIKAATATSNLMVGMTAATSAILMFARGEIPLQISALVAIGVFIGARAGSRQLQGASPRTISWVFVVFALFISYQMFLKGLAA